MSTSQKRKSIDDVPVASLSKKVKPEQPNKGSQSLLTAWAQPKASASSSQRSLPKVSDAEIWNGVDEKTMELLKLEIDTMDKEWLRVLAPEMKKEYFIQLKKFLAQEKEDKKTVYPPDAKIYSWSLYTPLSSVKVVILGQDPYHGPSQAHGLCFSVPMGIAAPPSLNNIYECLKRDFGTFDKPSHGFLESWAKQGVLLLNTSLTVRAREPASHSTKGWEKFTDAVIDLLNQKRNGVVFMLWGAHAQKKGAKINQKKHLILKAVHPSPLSAHKGFMDCKHFSKANDYLTAHGKKPIQWDCLTLTDLDGVLDDATDGDGV